MLQTTFLFKNIITARCRGFCNHVRGCGHFSQMSAGHHSPWAHWADCFSFCANRQTHERRQQTRVSRRYIQYSDRQRDRQTNFCNTESMCSDELHNTVCLSVCMSVSLSVCVSVEQVKSVNSEKLVNASLQLRQKQFHYNTAMQRTYSALIAVHRQTLYRVERHQLSVDVTSCTCII